MIEIQSKLAQPCQAVGHRFRGILAQASLNEVSLPLGAQFQAIEAGLKEPGPDVSKFGSGTRFPEPEGEVIIIHLCRNLGLYPEEEMTRAEREIQVMIG